MTDRYFSSEPITGPTVTLSGCEAHHLLHVMRAEPGTKVVLFDGQGGEFEAEVFRCDRAKVEFAVSPRQAIERELPHRISLAVPLPKGDRQRWLIEKAVELGVSRLACLKTSRSLGKGESNEKLARYVVEASKQCGRNRLMEISPAEHWGDFVRNEQSPQRVIAHPGGKPFAEIDCQQAEETCLAVGPEGGFTDEEIAQAVEAGWEVVGLGDRILRVETAALALIARLTV